MDNMDVTDLVDNLDSTDADLAEISGLLKNAENNESVNDDILELLESVKVDSSDDSDFDIFDEHELREVLRDGNQYANSAEELESIPEKKPKKKKRPKKEKKKKEKPEKEGGLKKKLFGRKKKTEDSDENADLALDINMGENGSPDVKEIEVIDPEDDISNIKEKPVKSPGLFSKIKELLTEEDEEAETSKDSIDGLKEINESDRKKIKKEAQKKKEKKEKKGNKKEKAAPKKVEKKKKEKKEKKPREVVIERPILSKKVLILMVALCATLLASIFILSNLLPEYEQRQKVRTAFSEKDYETVYKFLYNKKRNSNETIMYEQADLILKLERKWKSYQNNMMLNQELEALHALMQGVDYYHGLTGVGEYETQNELDMLYQQICGALGGYGITPEEAVEIIAYDDIEYTKKLTAIVNGTDLTAPGGEEAQEEPMAPQDILPEEEEIIGLDSDN